MPFANKRELPQLEMRAEIDTTTINEEDRTVEIVFTTGEGGVRGGFWSDPYIEELDVTSNSIREARLQKGLSVIDSHRSHGGIKSVFGVTEGYTIKNNELRGKVRFSKRPEADEVFQDVKDKILRHFSLGYRVWEYTEKKPAEENAMTIMRATDWEPTELSIVPVSFETQNGLRSLSGGDSEKYPVNIISEERQMPQENNEAPNTQRNNTNAPEGQKPEAGTRSEELGQEGSKPEGNNPESGTRNQEPAQATRATFSEMLEIAQAAGLQEGEASRAFLDNQTTEQFRAHAKATMTARQEGRNINTQEPNLQSDQRRDQAETTRAALGNALEYRANPGLVKLTEAGRDWAGLTLMETARQLLIDNGEILRGMSKMQVAERAMHSTSDFPKILADVANKTMRSQYAEVPKTFESLGRRSTLNDFKDKRILGLGDAPDLKKINEHGEYTRGTMSETGEQYRLHTYGRIFSITRQTLINDDMDAFTRLPGMWGASASRLQSDLVWGLLLGYDFEEMKAKATLMADKKNLFHADHNNLLTGAGSALSKAALSSLRQKARQQKTIDNKRMNVMLQNIVVPTSLETAAEELLFNAINPTTDQETNSFKGKYGVIVEPRLDDVSDKSWLAFANAAMVDTFEYAFLAGEEELNIETRSGFEVDGFEIRARTDFGCGIVDSRGIYKASGS